MGLPSPPDDEIVKTLCGVPGSETPPVLEVSAYGLRCLSRRERERVNESVLKRKTRDNHRERERSDPHKRGVGSKIRFVVRSSLSASAKNRKKKKHAPAAAARLNPPRARANTCSSL